MKCHDMMLNELYYFWIWWNKSFECWEWLVALANCDLIIKSLTLAVTTSQVEFGLDRWSSPRLQHHKQDWLSCWSSKRAQPRWWWPTLINRIDDGQLFDQDNDDADVLVPPFHYIEKRKIGKNADNKISCQIFIYQSIVLSAPNPHKHCSHALTKTPQELQKLPFTSYLENQV